MNARGGESIPFNLTACLHSHYHWGQSERERETAPLSWAQPPAYPPLTPFPSAHGESLGWHHFPFAIFTRSLADYYIVRVCSAIMELL